MVFLYFLKTFSLTNEGFGVLEIEKWSFLIFFFLKTFLLKNEGFKVLKTEKVFFFSRCLKIFFVEERRVQSSNVRPQKISIF